MKAVLSIILNPAVPFAKLTNAVGHICLGLGKDIDRSVPLEIAIRIAPDANAMCDLRNAYLSQQEGNLLTAKVVDFTATMTGDTYVEQLAKTASCATNELEYYAVAGVTTAELASELLQSCLSIPAAKDQEVMIGGTELLSGQDNMPDTDTGIGFSIVLDKKTVEQDVLLGIAISSLTMGANLPEHLLKLLTFKDENEVAHAQISAHSYVMLTAKNASQLQSLATTVQDADSGLVSYVQKEPAAVCLFGFTEQRRAVTSKCSLLKGAEPIVACAPSLT